MRQGEAFADTGYWIALANAGDELHDRARQLSGRLTVSLVTTDAILVEVDDAFASARLRPIAVELIRDVRRDPAVTVVPLTDELLERALTLYAERPDKVWGLTDCISFIVMRDRGITEALAYDQHFVQAGFRALLRE